MIQEDYVSFEVAKLLKEKGFDEKCLAFYDGETKELMLIDSSINNEKPFNLCLLAPTHQMAVKWLREMHNIDICTCRELDEYGDCFDGYISVVYQNENYKVTIRDAEDDLSFEKATEKALKYCLTILI